MCRPVVANGVVTVVFDELVRYGCYRWEVGQGDVALFVAIEYGGCVAEAVVCSSAHVGVEVVSVGRSWEHVVVFGADVAEVVEVIAKGLCAAAVAVAKICHLREGYVHTIVLIRSVAEGSCGFILRKGSTDSVDVVPVGALEGIELGVGVGDAVDVEVEIVVA